MPFFSLVAALCTQGHYTASCICLLASHLHLSMYQYCLALSNLVLLPWGFTLYCKLVNRCCVSQLFWSACGFLICICKQKESSLLLTSVSSCLYRESPAEYLPTLNWYAFGFLDPFLYVFACFFLKHK